MNTIKNMNKNMKIEFTKISKIEKKRVGKTYDFAVEDTHRIIAKQEGSKNGFYTSNCWHPDVEEFITAKQTPGRLTKFNMSVLITDAFMEAVKNNLPWNLEFPDYETYHDEYKKNWDGNIEKWKSLGYTTVVYKTYENANILWDMIMSSTFNRNEPGVLFVDTMNKMNNLYYCEHINATNPSLRAGTKVLTKDGIYNIEDLQDKEIYVKNLNGEWSFAKCFLSGKDKQLYKITLCNGREIYATPEHKWPVKLIGGGWGKVTTNNLKSGNILPFPEQVNELNIDGDMTLTREQGFMLGWMYGDGWITKRNDNDRLNYGFIFNENETYLADVILNEINSTKENRLNNLCKSNKDTTYSIQVSSEDFVNKMKSYGVVDKSKLPDIIWKSNDKFIKGFIDGIFSSDGFCSKNTKNRRMCITNKYKNIIEELSILLSFYGIKTSINYQCTESNFPNKKDYNKTYERYDLYIEGNAIKIFNSVFDVSNKEKSDRIKILANIEINRKVPLDGEIKIKSIELTDIYEDVWDISVFDDTHCFHIGHCITGNCGEQILPIGGVCLLGSINLTQFINFDSKDWDYKKLGELIPIVVRMMDNVNDKTYVPLESQREGIKNKRRIGLGIMGYGSALMMLKIRYGSKKALELTDKLMSFIANKSYQASALLAKEKGAFLLYDEGKYLNSNFIKTLDSETIELIKKYGIRNSHLLSIQPTGNSSVFANNVSGGLEPLFMVEYIRTSIFPYAPDGLFVPKNIDWANKTYSSETNWSWIKEGDDPLLGTEFDGYVWKYDKSRGLLRETVVKDYSVRFLESLNEWDPNGDYVATTSNLNIDEHINTMEVMAKYIDSAMSKCIVEGTLITTNKGIVPIEKISINEKEDSFMIPNNNYKILDENGDYKKITNHYYGGYKDCFDIKFNNGFNIKAAYTHKFKTENGWKSVMELEKDDIIYFRTNKTENNNELINFTEIPNFKNSTKMKYPIILDKNYAKFIGMFLADGFTNNNSIGIVEKNEKVSNEIDKLIEVLFNIKPKISVDKRTGVRTHLINSRPLSRYFKKLFGTNALTKKMPNEILLSNNDIKKEFLSGLTLDGYLKEDKNLVMYEGYSKDISLKTSYILSSLGYNYYLSEKKVKNGKLSKISYGIKAYLTDNEIIPIEDHKCEYITEWKKQKQVFVENIELYNKLPKSNDENYFNFRNLRKSLKSSSFTKKELLDKLNIEYDDNLTCVKVTSIENIGKQKVYDIEVEDTHSYLINGLVSHNTINIPNEYSFEDFKRLYAELYNTNVIKGGTTYRAGTMASVLSSSSSDVSDNKFPKTNSPKRPKTLDCDVHHLTVAGDRWIVITGLYEKDPYEIFAFKKKNINLSDKIKIGKLSKIKQGRYDLELEGFTLENIKEHFESDEQEALTRMISTSLRHGADIHFIYDQLQKSEGTIVSFSKAIARTLKKYLKDEMFDAKDCIECESKGTLVMQEGCYVCINCGYSKCGS